MEQLYSSEGTLYKHGLAYRISQTPTIRTTDMAVTAYIAGLMKFNYTLSTTVHTFLDDADPWNQDKVKTRIRMQGFVWIRSRLSIWDKFILDNCWSNKLRFVKIKLNENVWEHNQGKARPHMHDPHKKAKQVPQL